MSWFTFSQCLMCKRWPMESICTDCRRRLTGLVARCGHCALPKHTSEAQAKWAHGAHEFAWTQAVARVDYAPPFDDWVLRLKFGGDWGLARHMGRLMRECPASQRLLAAADWVLPLPLSLNRLRERGYNQAAWLARQWMGSSPRLKPTWLVKQHHTQAQAQADRAQRWEQLQGSMALCPDASERLRGSRVLLVDDVMTTGATLDVASRCLLQAGVRRVDVVVFARTPMAAPPSDADRGPNVSYCSGSAANSTQYR